MKLLIACSSSPDKGSGILSYSKEITRALIELGHEIHFACPKTTDLSWFHDSNITYLETDQNNDQKARAKELIQYINNEIDAVINNDNSLIQSIAPAVNVPFISIGHFGKTSIASLACFNHQYVDYVVSISNDMRNAFIDSYHVPAVKCPLVYNGVEIPEIKKNRSIDHNEYLRVVFAGGGSKRKGADLVIKMLKYFQPDQSKIKIDWFGNVPVKKAKELEPYDFVNVHGNVKREVLFEHLNNADVLLFPSREEGCPMAMLEAMSYGVIPIVSNGVGAMDSIIISGKNGYVCFLDSWSKQAFDCLQHIAGMSKEKINSIKDEVKNDYLNNYTSTHVANRLIDLVLNPTVNRSDLPEKITILKWHRPFRKDKLKAPLLDRLAIRTGYLRKAGYLNL